MKSARRQILQQAGSLALLGAVPKAWPDGGCTPAPQCRQACGPTGRATEGPFYVADAPESVDINPARMPGPPMRIGGVVYREDGTTPIAGAKVEIWHADAAGHYHPEDNGPASRYRRSEINLRGTTRTDAQGRFAFDSIVPAHYGGRRRHLHWRVSAPGHRTIVTQSYWIEERGTDIDKGDGVDRGAEACRWIAFRSEAGVAVGAFDVVLKAAPA
jgi:protocatechuate 3,4-dioxygenase beta subunit